MAEPSKERIAAALALAEAVDAAARVCDATEGTPPDLFQRAWQARCDALAAYRATAPKLRTRAEVDAERILNLDAFRAGVINGCALVDRDQALCREETAPDAEPTALAEAGIYDFRTVPTALWESLGHELTVADRYTDLRIDLLRAIQAVLKAAHSPLGRAPESEPDPDKPVCCNCGALPAIGITLGRSNGGPWRCTAGGCHRAPECEECAQLRERIRQLEAQAALYDQECGMCGSTAEELVEYGEWRNARLQLLSPGEHSPSNDTERTTTP
ncbi:MAG TPA: hypothetical protein VFY71_14885 [Planctomycetota bacterium]|nr:hypothetical protein [Planctomycetota bacterium]